MSDLTRDRFLEHASEWVCAGYYLDIRYLILKKNGQEFLQGALVGLAPRPPERDVQFSLDLEQLRTGQIQCKAPVDVKTFLNGLSGGQVRHDGFEARFAPNAALSFFSETVEQSGGGLHLRISTSNDSTLNYDDLRSVDDALRCADPPFDGLTDLCTWLGVDNPSQLGREHAIEVRVYPPVDLAEDVKVQDDQLGVRLRALASFDVSRIKFGVRILPGQGLPRFQLAEHFEWRAAEDGFKYGELQYRASGADIVQCMLSVENTAVRRYVAVDRKRARTLRLAAVASLDADLDQLRSALKSSGKDRDAARFEKAVAMLLFLHGFAPTPHVDTDAPDLLVATPGGRIAIVECTLKVTDFNGKVSKLAGRRSRLIAELTSRGHSADVHAVLAYAAPKEDIVGVNERELARHNVSVVAAEDLSQLLDSVQNPRDPDEVLLQLGAAVLATQQAPSTLA